MRLLIFVLFSGVLDWSLSTVCVNVWVLLVLTARKTEFHKDNSWRCLVERILMVVNRMLRSRCRLLQYNYIKRFQPKSEPGRNSRSSLQLQWQYTHSSILCRSGCQRRADVRKSWHKQNRTTHSCHLECIFTLRNPCSSQAASDTFNSMQISGIGISPTDGILVHCAQSLQSIFITAWIVSIHIITIGESHGRQAFSSITWMVGRHDKSQFYSNRPIKINQFEEKSVHHFRMLRTPFIPAAIGRNFTSQSTKIITKLASSSNTNIHQHTQSTNAFQMQRAKKTVSRTLLNACGRFGFDSI